MKKTTTSTTKKEKEAPPVVITGVKGFDKDFKCLNKQYEPGKEYEEKEVEICAKGIHFCENPLDVLIYYPRSYFPICTSRRQRGN